MGSGASSSPAGAAGTASRRPSSILMLDMNRLKELNDTRGHQAGDEWLRQVTLRLRPLLGEGQSLARLGADEFGLLIEGLPPSPAGAHKLAAALGQRVLDAISVPGDVIVTQIPAELQAVADPASVVRTPQAVVQLGRVPSALPLVDPVAIETARAGLPQASAVVSLAAGRPLHISLGIDLP